MTNSDHVTRCKHCHTRIRMALYVGWVDARPSEEGGNHDLCTANPPDMKHEPATRATRRAC